MAEILKRRDAASAHAPFASSKSKITRWNFGGELGVVELLGQLVLLGLAAAHHNVVA